MSFDIRRTMNHDGRYVYNVFILTDNGSRFVARRGKLFNRFVMLGSLQISLDEIVIFDYTVKG